MSRSHFTASRNSSLKAPPNEIPIASTADFNSMNEPLRLSSFTLAIRSAVPATSLRSLRKIRIALPPAPNNAANAGPPRWPKACMVNPVASACLPCVSSAPLKSSMISASGRTCPLTPLIATLSELKVFVTPLLSWANKPRMFRNAAPPTCPAKELLASTCNTATTSSSERPDERPIEPTNRMAVPNSIKSVCELVAAKASTSTVCPRSLTGICIPAMILAVISAARPN